MARRNQPSSATSQNICPTTFFTFWRLFCKSTLEGTTAVRLTVDRYEPVFSKFDGMRLQCTSVNAKGGEMWVDSRPRRQIDSQGAYASVRYWTFPPRRNPILL